MEKIPRKYKTKDVEMLLGVDIIVSNAIADKEFLQPKRATWTDAFFENIKLRIDTAASTYLGADNAKQLRESTRKVYDIVTPATTVLSEIKVQINEDFKKDIKRRDEILNTLGFNSFTSKTLENDQEALIQFLYKFETNLTGELKDELIAKGISPDSLNYATSHSVKLKNANVNQEIKKGERPGLTQEAIIVLNDIYAEVISIAKISANFHKDDPVKKQKYSFRKVIRNMNNTPNETSAA